MIEKLNYLSNEVSHEVRSLYLNVAPEINGVFAPMMTNYVLPEKRNKCFSKLLKLLVNCFKWRTHIKVEYSEIVTTKC